MVKLCGPQTPVGKVLSGDAGMQLNLLNIMTRTRKDFEQLFNQSNEDSVSCLKKLVATIHYTAALYLHNENFKENAVPIRDEVDLYWGKSNLLSWPFQPFEAFLPWHFPSKVRPAG